MTKTHTVTAIGALADPVRRNLYQFIVGRHEPVSREEAAVALGISPSKAKFHLDRLEKDGLLDVEHRRLTGRSGPGAGRPAKLYRRASDELHISLPERRYDIVGSVLSSAVERATGGEDLGTAISASAYARGVSDADLSRDATDEHVDKTGERALDKAQRTLAQLGYEPEQRDGKILLHNCPFDALAERHRDLVCSINQQYVQGVLDATCEGALASELAGTPGYCCVVAHESTCTRNR